MKGFSRLIVVTKHGRKDFDVPLGRVARLCGFEIDTDLLSGGNARMVTDPAQMMADAPPSGPPAWPERYGRDGKLKI